MVPATGRSGAHVSAASWRVDSPVVRARARRPAHQMGKRSGLIAEFELMRLKNTCYLLLICRQTVAKVPQKCRISAADFAAHLRRKSGT